MKASLLRKSHFAILFALIVYSKPISAQGLFEDSIKEEDYSQISANYELNGYVRGGIYLGTGLNKSEYETKERYEEAALKIRLRKGSWGDAYSELRFHNSNDSNTSESCFALRETYVNAYWTDFDLRIGQQVVQWGKADGYNPTNVITPLNLLVFSPNEDDRRTSNFLIRSFFNWSALRLETIWVPVYKASVLPFARLELPDGLQFRKPNYPDTKIKHSAIALKLHLEGNSGDASFSYFDGFLPMPGFSATASNNSLLIIPAAYRIQMTGADFSTTAGAYGIRGELAYKAPYENEETWQSIPQKQIDYILGLDHAFGNLSLIIQYIGKYVFDYKELVRVDQSSADFFNYKIALWNRMLSGQLKEQTHAISFRPAWNFYHETLSLEILGQINLSTEEILLKPKLTYSLADDLSLVFGAQIYNGPDDTLFGMLKESNNAGFIELKASF